MRARPCLSRNIFSWLINICSLPGVLNNPVVLFLHVEHLGELYKGDKKTPTWLSRAPRVYIKSWNTLPLLCLELLDRWNYSLPSLKSFKLRQFLCSSSSSPLPRFRLWDPLQEQRRWEPAFPSGDLVAEGRSGRRISRRSLKALRPLYLHYTWLHLTSMR